VVEIDNFQEWLDLRSLLKFSFAHCLHYFARVSVNASDCDIMRENVECFD
jgi:hypothetical protein